MDNYAIRKFAETSSDGKDFFEVLLDNIKRKRKVIFSLVEEEDSRIKYSYCENRTKHAIRLLVYPCYYDRTIKNICYNFIKKNKESLLSWYAKKQIDYINSLDTGYITDEMKQTLISAVEKKEIKSIEKCCHKELVSYFKCRTDEIIQKEIGI